jgi:hypothetical protein
VEALFAFTDTEEEEREPPLKVPHLCVAPEEEERLSKPFAVHEAKRHQLSAEAREFTATELGSC